jgi:hypothetical protein
MWTLRLAENEPTLPDFALVSLIRERPVVGGDPVSSESIAPARIDVRLVTYDHDVADFERECQGLSSINNKVLGP